MPTFTLSNFQCFAKQDPIQEGWRPLINVPVTLDDESPGYRLSVIWAGCQGADCQRTRKSATIRRWVIYDTWFKKRKEKKTAAVAFGVCRRERRNPQPCVLVCGCSWARWYVKEWQIFQAWSLQHHFPLLLSAQMFVCAHPVSHTHTHTHPAAHIHTHYGQLTACIPAPAVPAVSGTW